MAKFRKKPVVIEAVRWSGSNRDEVLALLDGAKAIVPLDGFQDSRLPPYISIETLEGRMHAQLQDWIIKGVKGEFYPCKPDIFEATYEPVEENL